MTAMTAMAQYKVDITSDPIETYVCGDIAYPNAEIMEALGIADAATLQNLINEGGNVYIELADGLSNTYTEGDLNQWWLSLDGVPTNYADGPAWFVGISFDLEAEDAPVESGVVDVYVGQMPGVFKKIYEPSVLTATLFIKNGDKEVKFDVTLNVNPAVASALAAPATSYASLEIVKEYEWTIDFLIGKSYEGKTVSTTLDGIYEALGLEPADLDAAIADVVVTRAMDNLQTEEGMEPIYSFSDRLDLPENLAGGSWFGRYTYLDEMTGEQITIAPNAPMGWGAGFNTIYTQDFKLSEGEFSLMTGQYPNRLELGAEDIIELFICNGTKAAKVTIQINIVEPETIPFEEMTKAGEAVVEITATVDNSYTTKPFAIDMAPIFEALGTEELSDFYTWASEGVLGNNHTESSGGYYYDAHGYICGWGSSAAFFIARTSTSLVDGRFSIGQMSGGYFADITEPTTVSTDMIFTNGDKYYSVNVNYTVKPESQKGDEFEYTLVGLENIAWQMVPSASEWEWPTRTILDMEYIESMIGTTDFTIMTDKMKDIEDEEGNVIGTDLVSFDKSYSCDPKPGFWFGDTEYENEAGQFIVENAGWGTNSFGVCYADGQLTWFQYPGQRSVGDEYKAHLYLVNEETGAYLDFLLEVKYVAEIEPEAETVGQTEITHVVTADEADMAVFTMELDTEGLYEALEADAEVLEDMAVVAPKSSTVYYKAEFDEQIRFNANGYFANSENAVLQATASVENGKLIVEFDIMELPFDVDCGTEVLVRLGFEYKSKRYMYHITLAAPSTDAIASVSSAAAKSGIYTVSGIKLDTMQRGLNIVKMNDGTAKKIAVK